MKPRVNTNCMADGYAADNERIVEFSNGQGCGGLISFTCHSDSVGVYIYRCDPGVRVRAPATALMLVDMVKTDERVKDLLAALQALVAIVEDPDADHPDRELRAARAIIAKATQP